MDDVKLHHPVPTRQTYLPEPPSTPASPHGYQRYSSTPAQHASPPQQQVPMQHYPVPPTGYPGVQPQPYQGFVGSPPGPSAQQPAYGFVQPSMWGVNDANMQIGLQIGQHAVQAGQAYMQQNFGTHLVPMSMLKYYFNVSNSYVLHKLRLLVFPWRHKNWIRRRRPDPNSSGAELYETPRDDINAPDLYIPSMALVTYVLLSALQLGLRGEFNPRVLGTSTSSALGIVLLEFALVNFGCYLLSIPGSQVVDLVAYGGYKFVGIILTMLAGLLSSNLWIYYSLFVYSVLANAFFLLRSLRQIVLSDTAAGVGRLQRPRRISFLMIIAAAQLFFMLFLIPKRPTFASLKV